MSQYHFTIHRSIDEIDQQQWNQLRSDNNPFTSHQFLAALEHNQCVGNNFGWLPRHLAYYQNGSMLAVMPLYEKYNSYGELVFDYMWAEAYKRHNIPYYPKLVCAIPYTPVAGDRLLCRQDLAHEITPLFQQQLITMCQENGYSSAHILFHKQQEQPLWLNRAFLTRHDVQFHWSNRQYHSFDDFMGELTNKKRKNIRHERSKVAQQNLQFIIKHGDEATYDDWILFDQLYQRTFAEKWSTATLNSHFFMEVARTIPDQIVLILVQQHGDTIAGALLYRDDHKLYGRHWGCFEQYDSLHFETCYYRGIEYAIEHKLSIFEPGAQGEHKLARGFLPVHTTSSHYITAPRFREPIAHWSAHERNSIADYHAELEARSPYKKA